LPPSANLTEHQPRGGRLSRSSLFPRALAAFCALWLAVLMPISTASAQAARVLPPVMNADGRLGLCDVLAGAPAGATGPSWAQLAYNAGARVNRWEFRWDRLERTPGSWDFSATDAVVASSQQYGLQVEGILIGTPGWAVQPGDKPGNGLPRNAYLPYTDPQNLWAQYVRQTVTHYAGKVAYWEVWNEPALSFFWSNTPADYFQLLKVAYKVIKSVDPHASVLMAGMVVPDLHFFSQVLDAVNAAPNWRDNHGYFDAVAWHAYGPASSLYTNINTMRGMLAAKGHPGVPLWVTEDGFPASNPNGEPRQAAYVIQTIAYALAAGADHVLVYRASDDPTPKTWGLLSATGTPRLGYLAFQLAASLFAHARAVVYAPTQSVERFALYEPGRRVVVMWGHSVSDGGAVLSAAGPAASLTDWQGLSSALPVRNGQLHIPLPGASYNVGPDPTSAVVGGPPQFITEDTPPLPAGTSTTMLASLPGSGRRAVVFNAGTAPALVQLAAVDSPDERVVVQLGPGAVQTVDLDLLAGPHYTGAYTIRSASPVAAAAASPAAAGAAAPLSTAWAVPAAPAVFTLSNPSREAIRVSLVALGRAGRVRHRETIELAALSSQLWSMPDALTTQTISLRIQAPSPIALLGGRGSLTNAAARVSTHWYAVRPGRRRLEVFNPASSGAAHVTIALVGSSMRAHRESQLGAGHTSAIDPGNARAVEISSTDPVAVGYDNSMDTSGSPASQLATQLALVAADSTSRFEIYNPSDQPAHLSMTTVTRFRTTRSPRTLRPSRVISVAPGSSPSGLFLQSDVPVAVSVATR